MGYTYYQTFVLIPAENPLTFADVVAHFKNYTRDPDGYPHTEVADKRIVLKRENWSLRVYWEDALHVLVESKEIAECSAKQRPDADVIATCDRRITTAGDPDPDMEYFNDYVCVLDVLATFKGVFKFDPFEGKFMNEYGES